MTRILIIDDEEDILDLLEYNLANAGYTVERRALGRLALEAVSSDPPSLIVLDEMLPDIRGFDVLRELKARPNTKAIPVILLTARNGESDKLIGFELGADDYVTKPFSPSELVARVKAVLKRVKGIETNRPKLVFSGLTVDLDAHRVFKGEAEAELTPQEFRLLAFLVTHPNKVYNREQLIANAWDADVLVDPRTVDVHIRRLRARLEDDPNNPKQIETVRGSGYRFRP